MITSVTSPPVDDPAYRWAGFAMMVGAATIVAALVFEHVGGYRPCPLCLQQRWAYYAGIPAAFLALVLLSMAKPRLAGLVLFAVSLAYLANAGLGVYHAGAEWKYWDGPQTCGGIGQPAPLGGVAGKGLLGALDAVPVQRCDEAPWRFAGLSFAGWNVVISLLLCVASIKAAFASTDR